MIFHKKKTEKIELAARLGATQRRQRQASDGRRQLPTLPLKVCPAAQDLLPGLPSVETTHENPLHAGHQRRVRWAY